MRNITYIFIGMFSLFSLAQVSELRTIQHDGSNRQFYLYVPASYNQNNATPIMFNFHGGGGTASTHLNYTSDMRNLAESENFILLCKNNKHHIPIINISSGYTDDKDT